MTETLTHFIGGKQVSAPGALESINPSNTSELISKFPDGSPEDVNKAVEAARAAFPGWAGATPEVRADILDKAGSLIIERKEAIGKLLAREEGKTLPEAIGETFRAGHIFKYFAGEALRRPITVEMRRVLDRQAAFHGTGGWVFPARVGDGHMIDIRKKLGPVNEAVLGDPKAITPHDLRRGYIATATLAGVPEIGIKLLVGHSTRDITEVYARAIRSELPAIAARIEAALL